MARRTTYQPLIDHLAARTEPVVWLTFDEIEQILQTTLPPSARTTGHIWRRTATAPAREWRALGWRAYFARRRAFIIFVRDVEEQ